jgi:trk system potassium uptake protein TrkH
LSIDSKIVLRYLGLMIHVPGLMAVGSIPICYFFDEHYAVWPLLTTALISLGLGQILFRVFRVDEEARIHHGMIVAAIGWVIVPIIGTIPFLGIASRLLASGDATPAVRVFVEPVNALFESFSGFTGTGLTMALRPSQLPHSLQWWRSFMEWIGGGGVILLMLSVLSHTASAYNLYFSEGRSKRIFPSVISTVRTIWWVYLLFTAFSILLLRGVGMPWWEAINHGMTGLSTGGFAVTDNSIGDYEPLIRLVVIFVMILGAVSFAVHYRVLSEGRLSALWKDSQHRMLWVLLGLGSGALVLENIWWPVEFHWVDSVFQWVSALGTAGFQTIDLHRLSPTGQLLLSLAMVLGGAAGSTAGGLKQVRVVLLTKGLQWRVQRIRLKPHELLKRQFDGEAVEESDAIRMVQNAGTLAALWVLVLGAGVVVLLHVVPAQYGLSDVILEVSSAQGNVGLSTGISHPGLPSVAKLTLILSMWMGRLEIIPTLIVLSFMFHWLKKPFRRRNASA